MVKDNTSTALNKSLIQYLKSIHQRLALTIFRLMRLSHFQFSIFSTLQARISIRLKSLKNILTHLRYNFNYSACANKCTRATNHELQSSDFFWFTKICWKALQRPVVSAQQTQHSNNWKEIKIQIEKINIYFCKKYCTG